MNKKNYITLLNLLIYTYTFAFILYCNLYLFYYYNIAWQMAALNVCL